MITDFLTPSIQSNYTHPPELKDEIAKPARRPPL